MAAKKNKHAIWRNTEGLRVLACTAAVKVPAMEQPVVGQERELLLLKHAVLRVRVVYGSRTWNAALLALNAIVHALRGDLPVVGAGAAELATRSRPCNDLDDRQSDQQTGVGEGKKHTHLMALARKRELVDATKWYCHRIRMRAHAAEYPALVRGMGIQPPSHKVCTGMHTFGAGCIREGGVKVKVRGEAMGNGVRGTTGAPLERGDSTGGDDTALVMEQPVVSGRVIAVGNIALGSGKVL
ncbi:hypothetical protein DFH06DRAFT_1400431 [Mycena polygramma]|nr:hypothetical protein DFH06DRAFT_1400431 [Mycena polygramma]